MNLFYFYSSLSSWQKSMAPMALGLIFGMIFKEKSLYLNPICVLFINAIKFTVIPAVFFSIVCAIISIKDFNKVRRIGIKSILLFLFSMSLSSIIAIFIANIVCMNNSKLNFIPLFNNNDRNLSTLNNHIYNLDNNKKNLEDILLNIVPSNIFNSFFNANILQISIAAILIAFAINKSGEKTPNIKNLFIESSVVVNKLISIIMLFAPIGIFSLIATQVGKFGIQSIFPLIQLILICYLSSIIVCIFYYFSIIYFVTKINPVIFFKNILSAVSLSFSSSSSLVSLSESIKCAEKNLKISKDISGFVLPIGATLNLNGLAIYLSVVTIFFAHFYSIHIGYIDYFIILLMTVFTAMSAGGIPGSGIIAMGAVMSSVGVPLSSIPLVMSIDRIIDMGMTATSTVGNLSMVCLISKGELNNDVQI